MLRYFIIGAEQEGWKEMLSALAYEMFLYVEGLIERAHIRLDRFQLLVFFLQQFDSTEQRISWTWQTNKKLVKKSQ